MTGKHQSRAALFLTGSLLLVGCCFLPVPVLGEVGISVVLEPGFPLENGAWMIPIGLVDEQGSPIDVPGSDIKLSVAGQPVSSFNLGLFAPVGADFPSSVAVLVDGGFPATGNELLADFLSKVNRTGRKGLFLCGPEMQVLQKLGAAALTAGQCNDMLGRNEPGRLWDSILAAFSELGTEGSARKVLFVVSSGAEELTSEHPLATCLEGALRTRVAVHYLELPGNPAGAARLKELARKTGGRTTPFVGTASLRKALTIIETIQPLTVMAGDHTLPIELTVGFGFSDQVTGTATVAEPKPLSGPAIWILVTLILGVLAVAGAAFFLFRSVSRKSGLLVLRFKEQQREIPIPRSGVTIGSDPDNVLILSDSRIARHHAVVRARSAEVIITDLRSTHGTVVNGHSIRNASLQDGDLIVLGNVAEMTFRQDFKGKRKS